MPLVIKLQDVAIEHRFALKLKLRMPIPESGKDLRETSSGPRQIEDNLLGRMRMPLKPRPVQLHSFLCGGLHDRGIVVTGRALRTGHDLHRPGTAMFLMANRTRAILDDVRFVEGERSFVSFEMAGFAILVDRIKGDALVKPIAQHILEFVSGQLAAGEGDLVVTARTSVDQSGVAGGKRSRVKKSLVAPPG